MSKVKSHYRKNKFGLLTTWEYLNAKESISHLVSENAHDRLHTPAMITYQSKGTLDTVAGTKFRIPGGGEIVMVSARVDGAPSSADMKIDLLIDAISVFGGGYLTIPQSSNVSNPKIITRPFFNNDSNLKFQVNTIGGATGPYVAIIQYIPGVQ